MGWPKLSETLRGPKHPEVCRSCGDFAPPAPPPPPDAGPRRSFPEAALMRRWRECDELDHPTPVVVVLCPKCSGELIEKHPRLYIELGWCEPDPGSMPLCSDCRHRRGTSCPMSIKSGGPGVLLVKPQPSRVHVCRVPRRNSGWINVWPAWPKSCDRKETAAGTVMTDSEGTPREAEFDGDED
jgi:hypothetical protein